MRSRQAWAVAAVLALAGFAPAAAARDFDRPASDDPQQQTEPGNVQRQDTPDDPGYDKSEPDDDPADEAAGTSLYEERYDLFGFPSAHTRLTAQYTDPDSPFPPGTPQISGFNAAGAWKLARGRPDVTVAVLDTGIRWDNEGIRRRIALNAGEVPDDDGDGLVMVGDFAGDARVDITKGGRSDALDGQDVIRAFSDGVDDDGNGYVDDIAGWDFHDDDNDPVDSSSYFAAKNHGTGRMNEAAEEGDDDKGGLGVCPRCTIMPLRIWDTFVSDANQFALGMVYATDNGAEVIEGANGSLYHSAFAEAASQYAYDKGVAQVFSGDDLNTGNHNYPANYDHTMLIEGVATDSQGLGEDFGPEAAAFIQALLEPTDFTVGSEVPVRTYFRGANTTQFGGHSSISLEGATGSENTGKAAGAAALVISAARDSGVALRPDETRAILEQTAEDVVPLNTVGLGAPDFAQKGWDEHFGWGRADVGAAVAVAHAGGDAIPPEASIGDPDWYAPLAGATARIRGRAHARHNEDGFTWKLEWGPGVQPAEDEWQDAGGGASGGAPVTDFGELDLGEVREALKGYTPPPDPGSPVFKPGSPHPYTGQFTVRLTVTADDGRAIEGVDRKVLTAIDPTEQRLRDGFPKRMGTGGEAALRYADLDGDNGDELLVPLEDGTLHAYRPDGSELPGWPVTTRTMAQAAAHATTPGLSVLPPAREPLRGPVVGDLTGDGVPEIVTTAGRHVYAWHADGSAVPGFPVRVDLGNCRPEDQRQEDRHRKCGFLAGPALARIEGPDEGLRIVVPGLDGHLYALRADGSAVPGYPVALVDPGETEPMLAESINQPAVGDLDGDDADDIVVATNEVYGATSPSPGTISGAFSQALADLLGNATSTSSRVYAVSGKTGEFIDGWPIKLNGGIQDVLPLIGPGHDAAIFRDGDEPVVVVSTTGGALQTRNADGSRREVMEQGPALNLFESAVVGDLTGGGSPSIVKYQVDLGQAANLLLVGQNFPYSHRIGAFDPGTGTPRPGWPTITDDYQFLSSSTIARVAGGEGATNQVLAGTGLGLLHAYDGSSGDDVAGFPKITGGWLYSPAALAVDGRLAAITREGFLFEWQTDAPRCQDEWPSFRHDPQASGNHDRDGTAPGAPSGLSLTPVGQSATRYRIRFTRPRDDGLCGGPPAGYEATVDGTRVQLEDLTTTGETVSATVTLPPPRAASARATRRTFAVLAVDEVGNRGAPARATYDLPDPGDDSDSGAPSGAGTSAGSTAGTRTSRCRAGNGFRRVGAERRRKGIRLTFSRRVARRVTVDVFQQSIGRRVTGERLVARFAGRTRGITWRGRANRRGRAVRDGYLFARFRMALPGGGADVRRVALRRRGGRFTRMPDFHRPDRCGRVQSFKLERPVFGGRTNRALGISFRLSRSTRVGVTVVRGGKVVRRFATRTRGGDLVHRLRLDATGLPRGTYAVRLRSGTTVLTLRARRV